MSNPETPATPTTTPIQRCSFRRRIQILLAILGILQFGYVSLSYQEDLWSSLLGLEAPARIPENSTKPTILIRLQGELGNHMGLLAEGFGLKWYAEESFGMDFHVVSVHQDSSKWVRAAKDLSQCFPSFKSWDFSKGVTEWREYKKRKAQQEWWLLDNAHAILQNLTSVKKTNRTLEVFKKIYNLPEKPYHPIAPKDKISLPFITVALGADVPRFKMQYLNRYKELFNISEDCCRLEPDEDETVFHFRNFGAELSSGYGGSRLVDFGPNQTAHILLGHLNAGEKVAIISRFYDRRTKAVEAALKSRGLQVRVIQGQTGVQDFCFMLKAKKELVAQRFSTYAAWGASLGSAKRVRSYTPVIKPVAGGNYLTTSNIPLLSDSSPRMQSFKVVVGD